MPKWLDRLWLVVIAAAFAIISVVFLVLWSQRIGVAGVVLVFALIALISRLR